MTAVAAVALATPAGVGAVGEQASAARTSSAATTRVAHPRLDLGPKNLPEARTTRTLQPGVTLTRINRGAPDSALHWTLESLIPSTTTSPDPDAPPRAISDKVSAQAQADRLRGKGFPARLGRVHQPATADVPAGVLGYRVRVGSYPTKAEADMVRARMSAAGEQASSVYTGWDGNGRDRGPWHLNVVRIDPRTFNGRLGATYGPDLYHRETTSALAREAGATVGVNGGFFVLDPAAGAPGDLAGVGVYGGKVLSEPVNGRPALVIHADGTRTGVDRFTWAGHVQMGGHEVALDGINRVPGLIRNCGGDATDQPTHRPLHDTTCTDTSELVAFTSAYDATTPSGTGTEVLVDVHHRVRRVLRTRGATLPVGWSSVQGTGSRAAVLGAVDVGDRLALSPRMRSRSGATAKPSSTTTVVNGGPMLVRGGREHITQERDGFVHRGDPSFAYGWFVKRNPRTFAGVDARGRTMLVTVDGRGTDDLGLSIPETADVARSLGLVDAVNLDGGGSTAMAVNGRVVGHPSDATGERPVGDALLVTPRR